MASGENSRFEIDRIERQAELHASRRQWKEAIDCFKRALDLAPQNAHLLLQLSYIESLDGQYRAARKHALDAFAFQSRDPEVNHELIARLRTFNASRQMDACLERLKPLRMLPIPLLLSFAAQYSYLNQQETALELLDEAFRGDPTFPPTLLARGQVLMYLGRFPEAKESIRRARARAPEIAQSYWLQAQLGDTRATAGLADEIRSQASAPGRTPEDLALLYSALHTTLDRDGDHAGAWSALVESNACKRARLQYETSESRRLFDKLIGLPFALPSEPIPGAADPTPVFIVGMHRSGTTLLEQLLDGNRDVLGVGEIYDFTSAMRYATDHHCRGVIDPIIVDRAAAADFQDVGKRYIDGVRWRLGGQRFFTDKLPSNFLNIAFICRALPHAKILHMVRDPVETCFSNLRELFSDANPYSYDQLELAQYFQEYRRLMAHWNRAYPGRMLDVDYSRLTNDTEAVLREVSAFCGFDFDPGMLQPQARTRGIATASAVQVRGNIVAREQPKWKPYERYLQPMIGALRG